MTSIGRQNRRKFLSSLGLGGILYTRRGAFAQQLVLTPAQTEGPFYPDRLPLDTDNDLLIINDAITPAVGEVTWLSGRVLDSRGDPVRGAVVEIWQVDNAGAYIHSASQNRDRRDANFQGFGRFVTGSAGEYLFRTIKPALYPGRARHIHYAVEIPGRAKLVTQCYVQGEPQNSTDGVLNGIQNTAARNSVIVPFTPIPGSPIGELAARFDVVLGYTPVETPGPRPAIAAQNGVVNGATFHAGAAPGAWITIYGENLAPATRTWNPATEIVSGRLPASLDGVSVRINNRPASVYFISPRQINVQAPADDAVGMVQVIVTTAAGASDPVTVNLQPFQPGFFLFPQSYVAAVRADGVYIGPAGLLQGLPTVPARPNDVVVLFGTGFGPTNPAVPAGEAFQGAAPLSSPVAIRIGNANASVLFAGLSGAGLYQFNVAIPDLPEGDHAVSAVAGGVRTQTLARIRTQR